MQQTRRPTRRRTARTPTEAVIWSARGHIVPLAHARAKGTTGSADIWPGDRSLCTVLGHPARGRVKCVEQPRCEEDGNGNTVWARANA